MRSVDFYFDVVSPYSYLASTQLAGLARRTGATFRWLPIFLGGLFKTVGGTSPISLPAKGRYMIHDLGEWAELYGVALSMPKHFPFRSLPLQRGLVALPVERRPALATALFSAVWAEGRDVSSPESIAAICDQAGYDGAEFVASAARPEVKQALKDMTDAAAALGAFGAPTFAIDGRMYWGNDRLPLLERYLTRDGA